jgi:hypothetical protein
MYSMINSRDSNGFGFITSLCGLVVRVLGYRSGGLGSIPGTTRSSEEKKKKGKSCSGYILIDLIDRSGNT